MCVCMYVCMFVCIYVHTHIYIYIHMCIVHVKMSNIYRILASIYTYMYICRHTHTLSLSLSLSLCLSLSVFLSLSLSLALPNVHTHREREKERAGVCYAARRLDALTLSLTHTERRSVLCTSQARRSNPPARSTAATPTHELNLPRTAPFIHEPSSCHELSPRGDAACQP